jgi:glycine cleavage system H protein
MDGFRYIDIFSSKGLEYLLVIGFLLAFTAIWWLLRRYEARRAPVRVEVAAGGVPGSGDWFRMDDSLHYHQGHTWARPEGGGVFTIGIDDFAGRLLGKPDSVTLPSVGSRLNQGRKGWSLDVRSKAVDMLSPIGGQVIAVNNDVASSPELVSEDPYGEGWLMRVHMPERKPDLKNLLTGALARAWKDETVASLRRRMTGNLGMTLQDGGVPVSGFAVHLSADKWHEIVAELLLTD